MTARAPQASCEQHIQTDSMPGHHAAAAPTTSVWPSSLAILVGSTNGVVPSALRLSIHVRPGPLERLQAGCRS